MKRYNESGTTKNKKRSGRLPQWTTRDSNRLSELLKVHKNANLRYIWQLFNQHSDNTVRLSTMRRKIRALGMVRWCIKKSETVCRRNGVKIIKFAQAHRNWSVDDCKRVIFSDERYFVIGGENRTMIWRRYDEKYNRHQNETENTQITIRVMVLGCITAVGVGSLTRVE